MQHKLTCLVLLVARVYNRKEHLGSPLQEIFSKIDVGFYFGTQGGSNALGLAVRRG